MWISDVTVFLLTCFGTLVLMLYFNSRKYEKKVHTFMNSVLGAPSVPIIGCAYLFIGCNAGNILRRMLEIFRRTRSKYGKETKSVSCWVCHRPFLFTLDPQIIKAVLSSSKNTDHPEEYDYFNMAGFGRMFAANGTSWVKMRRTVNPAFWTSILTSFDEVFRQHTNTLHEMIRNHSVQGDSFDFFVPMHLCLLDIVCDAFLSWKLEAQKRNLVHLSTNMKKSLQMVFVRIFNIQYWSDKMFSMVGLQKEIDEATRPMRSLVKEMIEQRLKQRAESKDTDLMIHGSSRNFMEIMLESVESGALTKDDAIEESCEIFIGGSITTATACCWCFKMMAMWPETQEKAYQEVVKASGGSDITISDLPKLVYLEMVIKETLRHYTEAFTARQLNVDLKVDDETTIPAGITIFAVHFMLHHDREHYKRPGDFYPEHFSPENETNRHKYAFIPFLSGRRICPGNKYVMMSLKCIIANTLLRYKFSTNEKRPADIREGNYIITLASYPASGFNMKITQR